MLITNLKFGEKGKTNWVVDHYGNPNAVWFMANDGSIIFLFKDMSTPMCVAEGNIVNVHVSENPQPNLFVTYISLMGTEKEYVQNMNIGKIPPNLLGEAKRFAESLTKNFHYSAVPRKATV